MRRTRLALLASCIWVAAALAGGTALVTFGLRPLTILDLSVLAVAASGAIYALALSADRRETRGVAGDGLAGLATRGHKARIEPIAVAPAVRVELTAGHSGFAALSGPALVVTEQGVVLAMTHGFAALVPEVRERADVAALLGVGTVSGFPAETLAVVGGQRFRVRSRPSGPGQLLLELAQEAQPIADDDLDTFAEAVASGLTGFRFEGARARAAPALDALNGVIAELDNVAAAIGGISAGTGAARDYLRRNGGLAPLLRGLDNDVRALASERDEEAALRLALEDKLVAIARAIDGYRIAAAYTAQETRALFAEAGAQSAQGFAGAGALQEALGELAGHLRNLSDDQVMMPPARTGQDRAAA